ncbi:major facilitator superfamily domain-containing protein [Mucidula mucida]|nr:major facilitator superfamily domain-containing protein [Mucidula mucida]
MSGDYSTASLAVTATPVATPSRTSLATPEKKEPPIPPIEFPEGGYSGWATVVGAYTNAFGVYQGQDYVSTRLHVLTVRLFSWIGSVQIMLLFSVGLFSGRAFDRGYLQLPSSYRGFLLLSLSLFMLSLTKPHQYYQIFLCQGLGAGIAFGMLYVPAMSVIAQYFRQRRALAMGIVTSGSSLGGVLHPIMLNNLFHGQVGFQNGVRASAGLVSALMRTRLPPGKPTDMVPKLKAFSRDSHTSFFSMSGLLIPFFYLQLDAITHNIDASLSFYVLAILNGASVVGRILSSVLALPLGVFNLVIPCTMACSVLVFCLSAGSAVAPLLIISVLYGFFSGPVRTFPCSSSLLSRSCHVPNIEFNEIPC